MFARAAAGLVEYLNQLINPASQDSAPQSAEVIEISDEEEEHGNAQQDQDDSESSGSEDM